MQKFINYLKSITPLTEQQEADVKAELERLIAKRITEKTESDQCYPWGDKYFDFSDLSNLDNAGGIK